MRLTGASAQDEEGPDHDHEPRQGRPRVLVCDVQREEEDREAPHHNS